MTHLQIILKELAKRIGQPIINPLVKAEWTKEEKLDFQNWVCGYMVDKDARKELMPGLESQNSKLKKRKLFAEAFVRDFTKWIKIKENEKI